MARGSVIARILSEYSDKGTKAAVKDLDKVGKDFKKFGDKVGKAFAVATAASAAFAVKVGYDAVKAAIADQQSAAILANTLHNVAGANDAVIASIEDFITQTSLATGVVDDQLRPAFSSLLTTTRSVAKSQELLTLALDVSAGSGEAVTQVANDLARAYVGSTKGLKKYNLGLTDAQLKSKSFAEIQALLNKQFAGRNVS